MRGATVHGEGLSRVDDEFQSTRPVRGATYFTAGSLPYDEISIHAPRAGRDVKILRKFRLCRGISIHAPRAGRDRKLFLTVIVNVNFNPRAPCGARQPLMRYTRSSSRFQSTRPVRGATQTRSKPGQAAAISIHAPRAGRDGASKGNATITRISIHAPRAGRDGVNGAGLAQRHISIHAPRAGRDSLLEFVPLYDEISIHAPRAGRDQKRNPIRKEYDISIHAPRAGRDLGFAPGFCV